MARKKNSADTTPAAEEVTQEGNDQGGFDDILAGLEEDDAEAQPETEAQPESAAEETLAALMPEEFVPGPDPDRTVVIQDTAPEAEPEPEVVPELSERQRKKLEAEQAAGRAALKRSI